jgi:23S rRNA (cytosine1962-C5)-methyltransferase
MPTVILKKGRDKSILRKHPWIFSGAIESTKDINTNGQTVDVKSFDGKFLGYGSYSTHSQIAVRILSFDQQEEINKDFLLRKIKSAHQLRSNILSDSKTSAYRLINSESDSIPGLIVDKYNDCLVCQFLSAGAEFWKKDITEILIELFNPESIYERSDSDVRLKEGLEQRNGIIYGKDPQELIEIEENGNKFLVDVKNGHKTGFYLDQRDNRKILAEFCSEMNVLNCFSYSGGFSVYAIKGGALKVTNIDSSQDALDLAEKNFALNNISSSKYENINDDVFKLLRKFRDAGKEFDMIILDPPKFAESINQVEKAARGYKDINLLAIKLLRRGGLLFTFSCSGHISFDLFGKIVSDAALDSGKSVQIIKYLTQSLDHPIVTNFPESLYLKGLICRIN